MIMSFSQHGPRDICILSANGAISNVTLRQPSTSGGTATYEVGDALFMTYSCNLKSWHLDLYNCSNL